MHRSKGLLLGALLAVGALTLAACGGGDDDGGETVSADAYAADVCTAFSAWVTEVGNLSSGLQSGLSQDLSAEEARDVLSDFLGAVVDATDQLSGDLEAAGVPDVEDGEELSDALKQGMEDARAALEEAQGSVDDLPLDSPEDLQAAADELGTEINAAFDEAGGPLEGLESPELEEAFNAEPACSEVPTG